MYPENDDKKVTTERRTAITILKIKETPNIGKQINTGVSNRTDPVALPVVEAYENAQEALGLYITTLEKRGKKAPPDDSEREVLKNTEQLAVVITDMKKYRPKKAVKKTLSIPYWLNELAEKEHINFSGVLQEALKNGLGGI